MKGPPPRQRDTVMVTWGRGSPARAPIPKPGPGPAPGTRNWVSSSSSSARRQFPRPAKAVARLPLSRCKRPAAAASGPGGRLWRRPSGPWLRVPGVLLVLHGDKQYPSRPVKLKLPRAMRLHRPRGGRELAPLACRGREKTRRMLGLLVVVLKNRIESNKYIFAKTVNAFFKLDINGQRWIESRVR